MASIDSVSPGVSDVLQTLSSTGSTPISSALSSPAVQSALQNASPGDLVQLSHEALQLQEASGLFGSAESSQTAATPGSLLLQALNSFLSGSITTGATAPGPASSSSTIATASEAEQTSALFGNTSVSLLA